MASSGEDCKKHQHTCGGLRNRMAPPCRTESTTNSSTGALGTGFILIAVTDGILRIDRGGSQDAISAAMAEFVILQRATKSSSMSV